MKRKISIVILCIAILVCSFTIASCGEKEASMLDITKIVGIEDATVEIGTYYEVPKDVYCEDKNGAKWTLARKIAFDGAEIAPDEFNRIKINKIGDYKITYTFDGKGYNKYEKTFIIKGVDTLKPIIKINNTPLLKINQELDLSALKIDAKDNSGDELEITYKLFYGKNDISSDIKNNKFTPKSNGVYRIVAQAKDKSNLVATDSIVLEAKKENELESFDNEEFYLVDKGQEGIVFDRENTTVTHNTDQAFILEGNGSVRIKSNNLADSWPEVKFKSIQAENLEKIYSISFYVFNNGSKDIRLSLMNKSGKFAHDILPQIWNKVELLSEDFAEAGLKTENKIELSKLFFWIQQASSNNEKYDVYLDGLFVNYSKPKDITFAEKNKGINLMGETITISQASFGDDAKYDYLITKPNGAIQDISKDRKILMDIDGEYLTHVKADNGKGVFSYAYEKIFCINLTDAKHIKKLDNATIDGSGETPNCVKELISDASYLIAPNKNAIKISQTLDLATAAARPWVLMSEVLNNDITNYSYIEYVLWVDGVGDKELEFQPNGVSGGGYYLKDGWNVIRVDKDNFQNFGILANNIAQKNGNEDAYITFANHNKIPFTAILSAFYAGGKVA